jgi:hypothetical protein
MWIDMLNTIRDLSCFLLCWQNTDLDRDRPIRQFLNCVENSLYTGASAASGFYLADKIRMIKLENREVFLFLSGCIAQCVTLMAQGAFHRLTASKESEVDSETESSSLKVTRNKVTYSRTGNGIQETIISGNVAKKIDINLTDGKGTVRVTGTDGHETVVVQDKQGPRQQIAVGDQGVNLTRGRRKLKASVSTKTELFGKYVEKANRAIAAVLTMASLVLVAKSKLIDRVQVRT